MMKKNWIIFGLVIISLLGIGYWIFRGDKKPLPGEAVADMGNNHVTDIADITYNSNPPSSGPHFAVWAKPGVYDRFISDGYFIHSMEHGYIIIWYDCDKQISSNQYLVSSVYAHGDEPVTDSTKSAKPLMHLTVQPQEDISWITPQTEPEEEVPLPDSFKSDSCKKLVNGLSEFTKVAQRVIVTPRMGLDKAIALTAWGRIDKLDSLDKDRITNFIKAFHNKGPEKTME